MPEFDKYSDGAVCARPLFFKFLSLERRLTRARRLFIVSQNHTAYLAARALSIRSSSFAATLSGWPLRLTMRTARGGSGSTIQSCVHNLRFG